jgi:hypothetical protein
MAHLDTKAEGRKMKEARRLRTFTSSFLLLTQLFESIAEEWRRGKEVMR